MAEQVFARNLRLAEGFILRTINFKHFTRIYYYQCGAFFILFFLLLLLCLVLYIFCVKTELITYLVLKCCICGCIENENNLIFYIFRKVFMNKLNLKTCQNLWEFIFVTTPSSRTTFHRFGQNQRYLIPLNIKLPLRQVRDCF